MDTLEMLAAIDLGSNSFHMLIARVTGDGQLQVVDRIKDMVRLGGGLDDRDHLEPQAQERAIASLERFGERVRALEPKAVRAVGTNTFRKAKNAREFIARAEQALGHSIEIVDGREEGRLVYLGVAHGIFDPQARRRLVVDIGGGSTELILGRGFEIDACQSLYMGCVSYSQRFFPNGRMRAQDFERAGLAARQELRALETAYPERGWEVAIGSSGTIKAAQSIVTEEGFGTLGITLEALRELREHMIQLGYVDALDLDGLSKRRTPVFPGGLAILIGVFESLGLEQMIVSNDAMREGVLHDLYGRIHDRDARDATIDSMATRYMTDRAHAARVERTALALLDQVAEPWQMHERIFRTRLRWACQLHEIGLTVSHGRYHKHGSYLVENSDMAGFSRQDQQLLWALIRSHRRRFKPHRFDGLSGALPVKGRRLCALLRLAILLNRSRADDAVPESLRLQVEGPTLKLTFPDGWLEGPP